MNPEYSSLKISTEGAGHIAHELYGLHGVIKALPGELDFNFRIQTQAQTYILKVSRPDVDIDFIRYQQELLTYIANRNQEITSPLPIPDLKGNSLSETTDSSGRQRLVRLLSWVEGRLWSELNPIGDSLLFSLGEQAGGLIPTALAWWAQPIMILYFALCYVYRLVSSRLSLLLISAS